MKAVITDLDKTLLRTDKTVSEYTRAVLDACRGRGMLVMAATARPERSILTYQALLGFEAAATLNGARVLLPGRTLENALAFASVRRMLEQIMAVPGVRISLETDRGIFSNAPIPEWSPVVFEGFPQLPECGRIYKILLSGLGEGLRERAEGALTEDAYLTVANGELLQIMDRRATKWNGVGAMLGAAGIAPEDAVYFGDDNDDLEPIRRCGTGVAVANAIGAVLDAADAVAPANDLDGVARWIEDNLL